MYLKYAPTNTMGEALQVAAFVVGLALMGGGMSGAQAAVPAAQYANGAAPLPSAAPFGLLGADSEAQDDCEPDWSGAAEHAMNQPVVLLGMLDTHSKAWAAPARSAASAKGKKAAPAATAAPEVEAFPVALPQEATGPAGQETWEIIVSDKTLNAALACWASKAGWQLLWELPVDYAVQAKTTVHGSFEDAVGTVARSMEGAEIPMKAMFYEGNKVLRIMAKGAE